MRWRRAKNHLWCNPHNAEVTLARSCSTICLPVDQGRLPRPRRRPAPVPRLARPGLPRLPGAVPPGLRRGLSPQGRPHLRQAGRPPAPRPAARLPASPSPSGPASSCPTWPATPTRRRDPLFLRAFGVPFWALARVFGRGAMYWYRLEVGLGRNSVVGTTVRRAELPEHLLADEHHQPRDGAKNYVATTVGRGLLPGGRPGADGRRRGPAGGLRGLHEGGPGRPSPTTGPGR